jgi:hypothetical protein
MPMRQRDGRTVKLHVVATMIACLVQVDLPPVGGAQVSVALDCACVYGHSPIWDAALKRLHFVDIEGQKVHSYDPSVNSHQKVDMLERVGCVVPYVQNRLLVAGEERIYQLGVEGKHRVLRRLPGHTAIVPMRECVPVVLNPDETGYKIAPGARFHSGSCDDKGRLWLSFKRTTGRCDTAFYSLTAPPEWAPELDPGGVIHQVYLILIELAAASLFLSGTRCHLVALRTRNRPSERSPLRDSMDRMLSCEKGLKCHAMDLATVLPGP